MTVCARHAAASCAARRWKRPTSRQPASDLMLSVVCLIDRSHAGHSAVNEARGELASSDSVDISSAPTLPVLWPCANCGYRRKKDRGDCAAVRTSNCRLRADDRRAR
jgi:hypothetical protein